MPPVFEWDQRKARSNVAKLGVTFVEAVSVFKDPLALIFDDPSTLRMRHGKSSSDIQQQTRLLLVSFTEPVQDKVRIISARRATKGEKIDYEEHNANKT